MFRPYSGIYQLGAGDWAVVDDAQREWMIANHLWYRVLVDRGCHDCLDWCMEFLMGSGKVWVSTVEIDKLDLLIVCGLAQSRTRAKKLFTEDPTITDGFNIWIVGNRERRVVEVFSPGACWHCDTPSLPGTERS